MNYIETIQKPFFGSSILFHAIGIIVGIKRIRCKQCVMINPTTLQNNDGIFIIVYSVFRILINIQWLRTGGDTMKGYEIIYFAIESWYCYWYVFEYYLKRSKNCPCATKTFSTKILLTYCILFLLNVAALIIINVKKQINLRKKYKQLLHDSINN